MTTLLFLLLACGGAEVPAEPEPVEMDDGPHAHHHHTSEGVELGEPAEDSVYQLQSTWTDQAGTELTLSDLAGQPVVLAMVYTHCEAACPRIIADMRHIGSELEGASDRVRFVLVSIDPERDTVERLAAFSEETGIGAQGWRILRGSEGNVRELAAVLGVRYRTIGESDFAHSNAIHVLDEHGVVVHQQEGLGTDPKQTVSEVRDLLGS